MLPEVYVHRGDRGVLYLLFMGKGRGHGAFPYGVSRIVGGLQPPFNPSLPGCITFAHSLLAEVLGRYRLPNLPTTCPR